MYNNANLKQWDVWAVVPNTNRGIERQNRGPMTRAKADEMVTRLITGKTKSPRAYVVRSNHTVAAPKARPVIERQAQEVTDATR